MLSFCLNGDLSNLNDAEEIVSKAPEIPNWEFYASRPPKQWDLQFLMRNKAGRSVCIDARQWQYSLVSYDNGSFFDITLFGRQLPKMDEVAVQQAATIVLQGELGERRFLEIIGRVAFRRLDEGPIMAELSPISDLAAHLRHLLEGGE
jgi:hypothetical protein